MNCPKCNALNSGNARFCKACGADCRAPAAVAAAPEPAVKVNTLKCLKCRTENAPIAKFCKGCGAALASSAETAKPPLAAETPVIQPASYEPILSTPIAPEPAPLTSQVSPPVVTKPIEVAPEPAERPTAIAIDEAEPMLAPEPVPQPQPTALPSADGEQMGSVACFKCETLNSPSARFCKSCGETAPSDKKVTADARVTQPSSGNGPQRPWLLWACTAAVAVVLLGGGVYWMFSGSSPVPVATPTAPSASSAPEPTSPAPVSVPPAAPAPAPGADLQPAQDKVDTVPASTPETVASRPVPAEIPPSGSSTPSGPTVAEREAAVRAKQERDAKARQLARDKAMLDKTNQTLDDLLKN
jgi:ribosomal protein L40E